MLYVLDEMFSFSCLYNLTSSLVSVNSQQFVFHTTAFLFRPKLPQKLRTGKQWNEDNGSPAKNRVSASSSLSATSLNEIDELEEAEFALDDAAVPSLKIDRPALSRTPSPEIKVYQSKNSFHNVKANYIADIV